jgi:SNF2 family DNA or RNA helicase
MFCGQPKHVDAMISITPSVRFHPLFAACNTSSHIFTSPPQHAQDVGCFSKSAHQPLVLSRPYSALVREKLLADRVVALGGPPPSSSSEPPTHHDDEKVQKHTAALVRAAAGEPLDAPAAQLALWALQRQARAAVAQSYVRCHAVAEVATKAPQLSPACAITVAGGSTGQHAPGITGAAAALQQLVARRQHTRVRRQNKKDIKVFEKEERKRRVDAQKQRSQRADDYFKELLAHRDEFFRFHKAKRGDARRAAAAVRLWLQDADARKEKAETKAAAARIRALKENDMDAYARLLEETKNDRLHYLINQTDSYLATINKMVDDQRLAADDDDDNNNNNGAQASSSNASSSSSTSSASQNYYDNTHRHLEKVQQPTMLKGGDLKEYQLGGLQWLVSLYNNNLNGILADEMGLGKTIQAISLLAYVMEFKHNRGPFLIVVPLSTLSNWVNELNKWVPDVIKVVYKGAPNVRKQIYHDEIVGGQFNVLLTTYEYIMKDKTVLKKFAWQYIIVDEGHRMKNAQSKFAQTLGTAYQSRHRILLTGTPLQNNLPELWALLNFLLPTIFSSVDTFDQWFNKPFAAFRASSMKIGGAGGGSSSGEGDDQPATLSQEEQLLIVHRLHEVLRPFVLRRVKDQVLDQLPEKTERVLRCELSPWQRKLYRAIHTRNLATHASAADGGAGKGKGALKGLDGGGDPDDMGGTSGLNNTIMQLRKVCNHPYLFLNDYYVDEDLIRCSGKFELLDRMLPKLRAAGHRVLMFSQMTQVMTILEAFFVLRGFACLRLDGSTSAEEREKRMYMFNEPDSPYFIFLLSTRAGGLGLNLATADTVILFDSDWNPMMDAQAQDRAHRIGQKNEVRVFRLCTNTAVEEKILARATDKKNLNGLVVEAGKFNNRTNSSGSLAAAAGGEGGGGDGGGGGGGGGGDDDPESNRAMMESLLKEWSAGGTAALANDGAADDGEHGAGGDEAAEAEVPDDDAINEMMATHDSELLLYQRMDRERRQLQEQQWAEVCNYNNRGGGGVKGGQPPMPSRLMGMHERPAWITAASWSHRHAQLDVVMMADGDGTWVPPKKGKRSKPKGEGGGGGGLYDDDEDDDDEGPILGGKAMRKRKDVAYDDGLTDLQFTRAVEKGGEGGLVDFIEHQRGKQRGRASGGGGGGGGGGLMGAAVTEDLLAALKDLQRLKRDDGTLLAELFVERPDKRLFPDYYVAVARPVALKDMATKLRKGQYASVEDLELDMALMAHNARTYNADESPVFGYAEALREELHQRTAKVRAKHGLPPPPPHAMLPAQVSAAAKAAQSASGAPAFGARPPLPDGTHVVYLPAEGGSGGVSGVYGGFGPDDVDSSGGGGPMEDPKKKKRGRPSMASHNTAPPPTSAFVAAPASSSSSSSLSALAAAPAPAPAPAPAANRIRKRKISADSFGDDDAEEQGGGLSLSLNLQQPQPPPAKKKALTLNLHGTVAKGPK